MSELGHLYLFIAQGVFWLGLMLELGGVVVCLSNRRLSPMLTVAAVGFAGMAASGAIFQLTQYVFPTSQDNILVCYLVASILGLGSLLLLVFGLAGAFADIRRRLDVAKEPPHVLE
jgi:hypothetical protein